MILERQWQKTNRNINETYFINIKENITMETLSNLPRARVRELPQKN